LRRSTTRASSRIGADRVSGTAAATVCQSRSAPSAVARSVTTRARRAGTMSRNADPHGDRHRNPVRYEWFSAATSKHASASSTSSSVASSATVKASSRFEPTEEHRCALRLRARRLVPAAIRAGLREPQRNDGAARNGTPRPSRAARRVAARRRAGCRCRSSGDVTGAVGVRSISAASTPLLGWPRLDGARLGCRARISRSLRGESRASLTCGVDVSFTARSRTSRSRWLRRPRRRRSTSRRCR